MKHPDSLLLVLGNQLFAPEHLPPPSEVTVFLAEDLGLCTYVKHHQQKIVLFLAAMRAYADELRDNGYTVHYEYLRAKDSRSYEEKLHEAVQMLGPGRVLHFEIEDKPMEARFVAFASENGLRRVELSSPMFLCSRETFAEFADNKSRLLMGDFYKQQRIRHDLLLDDDGTPRGGRWSFDEENRKKLPKTVEIPAVLWPPSNAHVRDVIKLVEARFPDHPGRAADFQWPTTRQQANEWLDDFVDNRLHNFGPYEDAMTVRSATAFHSALTPCLNLGLLTPSDIIKRVMQRADEIPLASLEGFVRQVIGWREFVRGIYQLHSERLDTENFWSHTRDFSAAWRDGTTGIPPLDDTIRTAVKLGWTHHIPRLMVLGNMMTLCEIRPDRAHQWFMEMYVDSSEWVMGPNVYGMGIFSAGGLFATKPYICGSNYLLKMSDYKKGPWCDVVDGLYWRFIDKHRDFFSGNPRLALMPRALDRLAEPRRLRIFAAAEAFLAEHTIP